jgi:hypothetical protein
MVAKRPVSLVCTIAVTVRSDPVKPSALRSIRTDSPPASTEESAFSGPAQLGHRDALGRAAARFI